MKKLIKKLFGFYDKQDIENALANTGNAKDRDDYEWKFKQKLFKGH